MYLSISSSETSLQARLTPMLLLSIVNQPRTSLTTSGGISSMLQDDRLKNTMVNKNLDKLLFITSPTNYNAPNE